MYESVKLKLMRKFISFLSILLFTACNGVKSYKVKKPEFPLENVEIKKEHFVDRGEKDTNGYYDHYYEYDIYSFCQDKLCYKVRSYTDNSEEAAFFSNTKTNITKKDFSNPLFIHTYYHLKEKEGKTKFTYFSSSGYVGFELKH